MDESLKIFLFTISGSILGSITTVIITYITKKEETKKQYNEMIVKSAIENWHGAIEIVKANGKGKIPPLDAYVLSAAAFYSKMNFRKINKEELLKTLEDVYSINQTVSDFYDKR